MKKQDSRTKITRLVTGCLALLILFGIVVLFISRFTGRSSFAGNNSPKNDGRMKEDLARLSSESYEAVLLSMHSAEYFREEDFLLYRGLDTAVASHTLLNTKELSRYLDCVLESGNFLSLIYLCLDPELLWMRAGEKAEKWDDSLEKGLYSYLRACPDIAFEILLPYPYIGYWMALEEDDLDTLLTVYHNLVNELSVYPNVKIFFPGFEEWLMVNPDNYTDSLFDANELLTQKLFLYTFCDAAYQITPVNEDFFWNSLRGTLDREKDTPTVYPDLSDWCLVLFGDSVFGNYKGSFSIPGYTAGLSNAAVYNYAIGGTCASARENAGLNFPNIIDGFLEEHAVPTGNGYAFQPDSPGEGQESASPVENRKLCFLINYGFNDYFTGAPVENPLDPYDPASYKGGLRTCISKLQSFFPDARYIIMTPTHTDSFDMGRGVNSEEGDIFSAYIDAAGELAREMKVSYLDNYHDFTITPENLDYYLADGVHPNERGRLAIALRIMNFIDSGLE